MSFWYLATPYSKYEGGLEAAFLLACEQAALLINEGVPVFSPIAHGHAISNDGRIDQLDHDLWMRLDAPFMAAARGLVVVTAPGWKESSGIRHEIRAFETANKPVLFMEPGRLPPGLA